MKNDLNGVYDIKPPSSSEYKTLRGIWEWEYYIIRTTPSEYTGNVNKQLFLPSCTNIGFRIMRNGLQRINDKISTECETNI